MIESLFKEFGGDVSYIPVNRIVGLANSIGRTRDAITTQLYKMQSSK